MWLAQELVKRVPAFVYCLVADENVFALFGEKFVEKFNETGKTLHVKIVSSGETTKDRKVKEEIEDFMLSVRSLRFPTSFLATFPLDLVLPVSLDLRVRIEEVQPIVTLVN